MQRQDQRTRTELLTGLASLHTRSFAAGHVAFSDFNLICVHEPINGAGKYDVMKASISDVFGIKCGFNWKATAAYPLA
jgi:hypothetical protein